MYFGQRVIALQDITSDDQEITGLDYGDPVVKAKTKGTVLGKTKDLLPDSEIKGDLDCYTIKFDDGVSYDCVLGEVEPCVEGA